MKMNLSFIKSRRKDIGLSMQYMAESLGFKTASTYYKYENGYYEFRADMLPIMAKILKCEIKNFFA